ncbi:MAG: hypothetical protein JWN76_1756 [Chitinophagaceae bacterium]|nr:hypothetical protein [Chitinophagaceae bacterium]
MRKHHFQKLILITGLIFLGGTFIISYYIHFSDIINGFLRGFAIGLLLLAVLLQKSKKIS